ncbi:MAG: dTDP-4-dehydrorhamnose 3,5-epimerase [Bacteroidetes bacterium]|nr:dTDP-4-dehydrorhamnose 3,5-epimerase [Bacteroidota bacterium]
MTVSPTPLAGLLRVQPHVFGDARGFFLELHNAQAFAAAGLDSYAWVQDNLSRSVQGTVRGLHFQAPPYAQAKLVCCLEGRVKDVVVDIRKGSPTYGKAYAEVLDSDRMNMLLIPEGFAHGFSVLSTSCLFFYKCTSYYHKPSEGGLAWDDPALDIDWEVDTPILSAKDEQNPPLARFNSPF